MQTSHLIPIPELTTTQSIRTQILELNPKYESQLGVSKVVARQNRPIFSDVSTVPTLTNQLSNNNCRASNAILPFSGAPMLMSRMASTIYM